MKQNRRHPQSFTLVELVITTLVLAVLAFVAVPALQPILRSAKDAAVKASLGEMRAAIQAYSAAEISAGRASRFAQGTAGGWPLASQINEEKYGGTNIVLQSRNVPDNPYAQTVYTYDFDRVIVWTGGGGGGGGGGVGSLWILGEKMAYAALGDPPPTGSPPSGWLYNESSGLIWASTNVNGENLF